MDMFEYLLDQNNRIHVSKNFRFPKILDRYQNCKIAFFSYFKIIGLKKYIFQSDMILPQA